MAAPDKPQIDYSYTGFQQEQQGSPFPGTQIDNDLAELKRGVDATIDALADVRRSDGSIPNGKVTLDSLSGSVKLLVGADSGTATDLSVIADGFASVETVAGNMADVLAVSQNVGAVATAAANAASALASKIAAESAAGANLSAQDSRAAALVSDIPASVNYVRTAGYLTPGGGGAASYRKVGAQPAHAGKFQSVRGVWYELFTDVVSPKMFGAKYDNVTDDYQAHRDTLDFCKLTGVGTISLPPGRSYISAELQIDVQIKIVGSKGHVTGYGTGTTLRFPANTNGIRVCRSTTSTSGGAGDNSVFEDFDMECTTTVNASGDGFVLDARATIRNCNATGFARDGFHVEATATDVPSKNANNWMFDHCQGLGNRRHGFYFSGADANAGTTIGCVGANNGGHGFYDNSFLSNAHVGNQGATNGMGYWVRGSDGKAYACILDHQAAANTVPVTGANWTTYWVLAAASTGYPAAVVGRMYYAEGGRNYKADSSNAPNGFSGCYSETGTPKTDYILYPSGIYGGSMKADTEGNPIYPGVRGSQATTQVNLAGIKVTSSLGDRANANLSAFEFLNDTTGTAWRFKWDDTNRWWFLDVNNGASNRAYVLIDNGGTTGLPTGLLDFRTLGFALGGKRHFFGTAAPTTGTWAVGDRVYNTASTVGGLLGWICTTLGTPGTWTPFGQSGQLGSIASTPAFAGQTAVVAGVGYMAVGTASSADWKQITN